MSGGLSALVQTRPALRWHGGKWRLAPWIIGHFPPHRVYVEPYGGAASVLIRKPRAYAEVYNDLDDDVVGLFRVLRDPADAERLVKALRLTPFSRIEFDVSYETTTDPVEAARRLIVRSLMGFGSDAPRADFRTGFRAASNRSGTTPAHDWTNYPDALRAVIERFAGVVIEHRLALDVCRQHDAPDTLHYLDPPYLPETRSAGGRPHAYRHEMTVEQHADMLATIREMSGMVVLSGYPSTLYDDALTGWHRIERAALADGARARTEVLWLNPAAASAIPAPQMFARTVP